MNKNQRDKFKTFLRESGAEVLAEKSEYEVVRFKTVNGTSVVYCGKKGIKFSCAEANEAYANFKAGNIWQILRKSDKKRQEITKAILKRDGDLCFYCGVKTVAGDNRSVEHLLSIARGGNNNIANLAIACIPCNLEAADLDIVKKIKLREVNIMKQINKLKEKQNGKK